MSDRAVRPGTAVGLGEAEEELRGQPARHEAAERAGGGDERRKQHEQRREGVEVGEPLLERDAGERRQRGGDAQDGDRLAHDPPQLGQAVSARRRRGRRRRRRRRRRPTAPRRTGSRRGRWPARGRGG